MMQNQVGCIVESWFCSKLNGMLLKTFNQIDLWKINYWIDFWIIGKILAI